MIRPALMFLVCLGGCSVDPEVAPSTSAGTDVVFHDVGAGPRSIAVADFDGDGKADAAVVNSGAASVSILRGDGTGGLGPQRTFAAGREPSDVDAADVDRDGRPDLVIANHETSRITVLRNLGAGAFAPMAGSPFETGAVPHVHGLATGDFDADGRVDVAVESSGDGTIRLLRGTAAGFAAPISIAAGTMPYYRLGVAIVDGAPRIIAPGHGDATVRIIDRSAGAFAAGRAAITLSGQPWMVVGADVNGDGAHDIVVAQTDAVSVWHASGGSYERAPGSPIRRAGATEVAAGDVEGDGSAEVAVGVWDGKDVTIRAGRTGVLTTVAVCERAIGLALADLDGDGRAELLATCTTTARLAVVRFRKG